MVKSMIIETSQGSPEVPFERIGEGQLFSSAVGGICIKVDWLTAVNLGQPYLTLRKMDGKHPCVLLPKGYRIKLLLEQR